MCIPIDLDYKSIEYSIYVLSSHLKFIDQNKLHGFINQGPTVMSRNIPHKITAVNVAFNHLGDCQGHTTLLYLKMLKKNELTPGKNSKLAFENFFFFF